MAQNCDQALCRVCPLVPPSARPRRTTVHQGGKLVAPHPGIVSAGTMSPRDDTQGARNIEIWATYSGLYLASSVVVVGVMFASPPSTFGSVPTHRGGSEGCIGSTPPSVYSQPALQPLGRHVRGGERDGSGNDFVGLHRDTQRVPPPPRRRSIHGAHADAIACRVPLSSLGIFSLRCVQVGTRGSATTATHTHTHTHTHGVPHHAVAVASTGWG